MKSVLAVCAGIVAILTVAFISVKSFLPSEEEIKGCLTTKMFEVHLCPNSGNYVSLKKINPIIYKTIILTEDSDFYNHKGFDWGSIEANFKAGWKTGSFKRGGSTITQQLAKNLFLTKDRTFIRKGIEALITNKIESTLSKNEILEKYLNVIEFGEGVYGIKNAARYYFKKSPSEVNTAEAAFLAMILPNPIKYSASFYKKGLTPFAYKRMSKIINDLYAYHRITEENYTQAKRELTYFFGEAPPFDEDSLENIDIDTIEQEIIHLDKENRDSKAPIKDDSEELDVPVLENNAPDEIHENDSSESDSTTIEEVDANFN